MLHIFLGNGEKVHTGSIIAIRYFGSVNILKCGDTNSNEIAKDLWCNWQLCTILLSVKEGMWVLFGLKGIVHCTDT